MARLYEALERAEQDVESLTVFPAEPRQSSPLETPGKFRVKLMPVYQRVLKDIEGDCRTVCLVGLGDSGTVATLLREFAMLAAQEGGKRVLLLEGPDSEGALFRHFGVQSGGTIQEVLAEKKEVEDVLHTTLRPGLSVARLTGQGGSARAVVTHQGFDALHEKLRQDFDFILFGTAIGSDQSEAAVLACKSDGAVLVVESGKTRWQVAKSVCNTIESLDGRVIGAVLNNRRHYIPSSIYRWL